MVGKLNLNLGDDYGFYIRRAREVAEGTVAGGGGQPVPPPDQVYGPYTSGTTTYWIQRENGICYVWFDVDADPDPDVRQPVADFLADTNNDVLLRQDVQAKAEALGC